MQALKRALVSVIITLLNDSERSLNKKWLRPVTNKCNRFNGHTDKCLVMSQRSKGGMVDSSLFNSLSAYVKTCIV